MLSWVAIGGKILSVLQAFSWIVGQELCHGAIKALAYPAMELLQASGWLDPDTWSVMSQYCEDLTEKAEIGKIHDALGRDKQISSMIDILTRSGKGNPCVVGDAGVGKTALVEGLAYRIAHGDVPEEFKNKKIIKVNMVSLIAGKSYNKGDGAVGRMRALFDKAAEDPDVILFIDEFHQIVQCNAAELFKTYLDRGNIRVIAATTTSEYSYISKDPALERRFTKVFLEEPNRYETLEILRGLKSGMEKDSEVKITDESLLSCVELTGRYMKNRFYPDKAIDVISSASKMVYLKNKSSPEPVPTPLVTEDDIKSVVATETNIPMTDLSDLEVQLLNSMEDRMKCRIKGQDEAVKCVSDAVRRGRIGITSLTRPRASFLFTGTSGVGKTALAEALGSEVGNTIKIDMSQYNGKNSFVERVWKKPYSVVVFDGIEKADIRTLNMILSVLENGYIMDSAGDKVDFTNTIIIMTTNIGEKLIFNADKNEDYLITRSKVLKELEKEFGTAFLNRIDETLVFNKLNYESFRGIAKIFMEELEHNMALGNINLKIEEEVVDYISQTQISHKIGARQLQRIICEKIEKPLACLVIENRIKKGDIVVCKLGENGFEFEVKK